MLQSWSVMGPSQAKIHTLEPCFSSLIINKPLLIHWIQSILENKDLWSPYTLWVFTFLRGQVVTSAVTVMQWQNSHHLTEKNLWPHLSSVKGTTSKAWIQLHAWWALTWALQNWVCHFVLRQKFFVKKDPHDCWVFMDKKPLKAV